MLWLLNQPSVLIVEWYSLIWIADPCLITVVIVQSCSHVLWSHVLVFKCWIIFACLDLLILILSADCWTMLPFSDCQFKFPCCLLRTLIPLLLFWDHYFHVLFADSLLLFWLLSHVQNIESCSRSRWNCIVSNFFRQFLDYVLVFHLPNLFSLLGQIPLLGFSYWVLIVDPWSHVMIVGSWFPDLFVVSPNCARIVDLHSHIPIVVLLAVYHVLMFLPLPKMFWTN